MKRTSCRSSQAWSVKLWATRDKAGVVRVVVINKDPVNAAKVMLRVEGKRAVLKRLAAPSIGATSGITFAGQIYEGSADGKAVGALAEEVLAIVNHTLHFRAAPASAALATIQR